jgi:hypothetical protein
VYKKLTFLAVAAALTLASAALGMLAFQHLQLVLGYRPLTTALWLLPVVDATMIGIALANTLTRWVRPASVIGCGMVIAAVGFGLFVLLDASDTIATILVYYGILNLGMASASTGGNTAVGVIDSGDMWQHNGAQLVGQHASNWTYQESQAGVINDQNNGGDVSTGDGGSAAAGNGGNSNANWGANDGAASSGSQAQAGSEAGAGADNYSSGSGNASGAGGTGGRDAARVHHPGIAETVSSE